MPGLSKRPSYEKIDARKKVTKKFSEKNNIELYKIRYSLASNIKSVIGSTFKMYKSSNKETALFKSFATTASTKRKKIDRFLALKTFLLTLV